MFYSSLYVCFAVSCRQYFEDGYEKDGMYRLFVDGPCKRPVKTLCDQSRRFGGGWTLLVRVAIVVFFKKNTRYCKGIFFTFSIVTF